MLGVQALRLCRKPAAAFASHSSSFLHSAADTRAQPVQAVVTLKGGVASGSIGEDALVQKVRKTRIRGKSASVIASASSTKKERKPRAKIIASDSTTLEPLPIKKKASKKVKKDKPAFDKTFREFSEIPPESRLAPHIRDENVARDLVREWGIDKMHDAVVFEGSPAFGGLTKAILELKNVKQVIVVQKTPQYRNFLQSLQDQTEKDRLVIVPQDPLQWEAYTAAENACKDPISVHPWEEVHPNLFFVAQLRHDRHTENYLFHLITAAAYRNWLYKYGRVRMGLVGPTNLFDRITAKLGGSTYQKLAMLTSAIADVHKINYNLNNADFFHPRIMTRIAIDAYSITPRIDSGIVDYEVLEYVSKNMFILRCTPWETALSSVAIAAETLIPEIIRRGVPPKLLVSHLEKEHWAIIANVFSDWPFRPVVLSDQIYVDQRDTRT